LDADGKPMAWACTVYNNWFPTEADLDNHKCPSDKRVDKKGIIECKDCGIEFFNYANFDIHECEKLPMICQPMVGYWVEPINRPLPYHPMIRNERCVIIPKEDDDEFHCIDCGLKFPSSEYFTMHECAGRVNENNK